MSVIKEQVPLKPATKQGTGDLRELSNYHTRRMTYGAGTAMIFAALLTCFYIVLHGGYSEKLENQAWTLATFILGAVVGVLYRNND